MELFLELSRAEFTESALVQLDELLIPKAITALYRIFRIRQALNHENAEFGGIKLHLILHFPMFIRMYGAPRNWDSSSFESAHKELVKDRKSTRLNSSH